MNIKYTIKQFVNAKQNIIKNIYVNVGKKIVINYVFPLVGNFMKQLIIMEGKDPNYVAPLPAQPTVKDIFTRKELQYMAPYMPKVGEKGWIRSFKSLTKKYEPTVATIEPVLEVSQPILNDKKVIKKKSKKSSKKTKVVK